MLVENVDTEKMALNLKIAFNIYPPSQKILIHRYLYRWFKKCTVANFTEVWTIRQAKRIIALRARLAKMDVKLSLLNRGETCWDGTAL